MQWLPSYKRAYLSGDISAGITVGILLIPQLFYALLGTSRQLAVGPVAMDSLLVASGLGALSLSGIEEYISMAIFLAFFMGLIQLALGLLRMGFLVNFLSRPVISGFTSAAAIIIGLSQLKHLLGAEMQGSNQLHILLKNTFDILPQTNWIALGMGVGAILLLKAIKRIDKRLPGALLVVVLGIVSVYFFGLEDKVATQTQKGAYVT